MYSRDLSTKVRSAFRTRNLRGEYWGGNGFYGYQVHPHNKKRLIVDEQVRDIIVMIFESCVAGMTTSEIAQMLNDMGIPSPLEHIPGAINIPNETIGTEDIPELPDKEQLILVYCRSGNRSKQASEKLVKLGYTNIVEFGGINDWTGETVSGEA